MFTRIFVVLLSFSFLGPSVSRGQDQPPTPKPPAAIATDRPSFTNSSIVVPSGSFQAENGLLVTNSQGQSVLDGPETLLRAGVASRSELRLSIPNYFYNVTNGGGPGSGFSDLVLGVKEQLGPIAKFDVSTTLFLNFPTGAANVSSGGYDPGIQVAWSRVLTSKWTLAGMLSLFAPTQANQRNLTGESTLMVDRQLTRSWSAFGEYVGDFPERGGSRQLLHFGTTLRVTNNQQLDFHIGFGLTTATVDRLIGLGYSFRFFTK